MKRSDVPPVQVGDKLTMVCDGIGGKGDGVFRYEGYVIFVPEVQQGMEYDIEVTKVLPRVGFGVVIR